MTEFFQFVPQLTAMVGLLACSGFFSCSEAALFYLSREDRERLAHGNRPQKLVIQLLTTPEWLLTSILFWNLTINVTYFALASQVGLSLERQNRTEQAALFSIGALLAIILFGEMLPKNVAVLWTRKLASLVSLPLAAATRLLGPVIPTLQAVNRVSLRTLLPNFEREAYLELSDIERAITLSTPDKSLADHEELVLQQILSLSELEAEELMRPRLGLTIYTPPVTLADLRAHPVDGDYLLVAEPDSEELDRALPLDQLPTVSSTNLETACERVPYVPWCASGATTLEVLRSSRSGLASVVNEHGETIGIVTFDDMLHMLFANPTIGESSRAAALSLQSTGPGRYQLSGAITLRRLAKTLELELPTTKSVTVAGMLQEQLQRLPQSGDEVMWGNCQFVVLDSPRRGVLTATVEKLPEEKPDPGTPSQGVDR